MAMMKQPPHLARPTSSGFTLMEVMVSMGIFAILLPAVLGTLMMLQRNICNGIERNNLVAQARFFQQRFTKVINASQQGILFDDKSHTLTFQFYDETTQEWAPSWYSYAPDRRVVMDHDKKVILRNVYPANGYTNIFSSAHNRIYYHLDLKGTDGTHLELKGTAAPRNQ